MNDLKEISIYIHIPFCDHKCIYCDFYSITNYKNTSNYLSALKKEIEYYSEKFGEERKIKTIFFGGGTPSFMSPDYIREIIHTLKDNFLFSKNIETTLETNPGTVNKFKLNQFLESGINRLSIGIQSFDEDDLKFLTRIHDKQTAISTVRNAYEIGFENISIDLIFNLPKQTKLKWKQNLEIAVELPITHISAYSLILEPGTILNKMVLDGKVQIEDDDYDAELFEITQNYLGEHSFNQYEISNFAKENFECKHNKAYWEHKDYLGFGTSAHSFVNGKRWWNISSLNLYLNSINEKQSAAANFEILDIEQLHDEFIMLSLRSGGLNLNELTRKFNYDFLKRNSKLIDELKQNGFLNYDSEFIKLTQKGFSVCDEIVQRLI